jgi:hypothetical protein
MLTIKTYIYRIWYSHSSGHEVFCILGHNTTFQTLKAVDEQTTWLYISEHKNFQETHNT